VRDLAHLQQHTHGLLDKVASAANRFGDGIEPAATSAFVYDMKSTRSRRTPLARTCAVAAEEDDWRLSGQEDWLADRPPRWARWWA